MSLGLYLFVYFFVFGKFIYMNKVNIYNVNLDSSSRSSGRFSRLVAIIAVIIGPSASGRFLVALLFGRPALAIRLSGRSAFVLLRTFSSFGLYTGHRCSQSKKHKYKYKVI